MTHIFSHSARFSSPILSEIDVSKKKNWYYDSVAVKLVSPQTTASFDLKERGTVLYHLLLPPRGSSRFLSLTPLSPLLEKEGYTKHPVSKRINDEIKSVHSVLWIQKQEEAKQTGGLSLVRIGGPSYCILC